MPQNFEAVTGPSASSTIGCQAGRRRLTSHGSSCSLISSLFIDTPQA
jgi:hypothetical protein